MKITNNDLRIKNREDVVYQDYYFDKAVWLHRYDNAE